MNNLEWFGLKTSTDTFFLSQISLYPKALSISEFNQQHMLFVEKTEAERKLVRTTFEAFYEQYIQNSYQMSWSEGSFKKQNLGYNTQHISDFLFERNLKTYVDFHRHIIFSMDSYLEVLIYSSVEFHLNKLEGLFQRTKNIPAKWCETIWA